MKWAKDGKDYLTLPGKSSTTEIRELERVTSKLRIGDATQEDAGRYSCQASNAFGTSHFTIDVTIWGKNYVQSTLDLVNLQIVNNLAIVNFSCLQKLAFGISQ